MAAPETMRAATIQAGQISVTATPIPKPKPGYALVKVLLAGICSTDLELQRGYYNFSGVPGHEFVGHVADASDKALIGKRVAGEINITCGACYRCQFGPRRHCATRSVLGILNHPGAFAEYLTLPERNLHLVPDELSDRQAVFIEPVAAAHQILDQVRFAPGEFIAVLGDGKLGLLVAQVLHTQEELRVFLFGRYPEKLRLAAKKGIRTRID